MAWEESESFQTLDGLQMINSLRKYWQKDLSDQETQERPSSVLNAAIKQLIDGEPGNKSVATAP